MAAAYCLPILSTKSGPKWGFRPTASRLASNAPSDGQWGQTPSDVNGGISPSHQRLTMWFSGKLPIKEKREACATFSGLWLVVETCNVLNPAAKQHLAGSFALAACFGATLASRCTCPALATAHSNPYHPRRVVQDPTLQSSSPIWRKSEMKRAKQSPPQA